MLTQQGRCRCDDRKSSKWARVRPPDDPLHLAGALRESRTQCTQRTQHTQSHTRAMSKMQEKEVREATDNLQEVGMLNEQ
eukprot:EC786691.1.p2 GENE.EC786691.1~~EC786691.1.p2  ORF type:complete len:80 (-),score=8.00 EC786691.1:145-384(-)